MKKMKFQLVLLIITIFCLTGLVGIQINWILKQANLQEEEFNRDVKKALISIEKNLESISECPFTNKTENNCRALLNTFKQAINLDSLITHDLNYHGIDLDYEYGIVNVKLDNYWSVQKGTTVTVDLSQGLRESGYELKINFPKKSDFVFAQIGYAFISSLLLIILVVVSFMLIFRYYKREKSLTERIREFVNNMTHEFKTPLANIAFANSMISKHTKVENDVKLQSLTQIIKSEQAKLNDRVEKLLSTSNSNSEEIPEREKLDLSVLIQEVINSNQAQILTKNGNINFHGYGDDHSTFSNGNQLHIILDNLIDNSIKYCIVNPQIDITLKSSEKYHLIEVKDNGIGISPDQQKLIFDQYYRVPTGDVHDIKGFGIGLFHVKRILDQIGGEIQVNSEINKGSQFVVKLPNYKK